MMLSCMCISLMCFVLHYKVHPFLHLCTTFITLYCILNWSSYDIIIPLLQIGQYIGSNGGVVTAEELAPYLDVETAEKTV